ncbi:HupE/UreJ family protein [Vibrio sp. EA2]|uniref:HupE/UreJ family protein n=1 Tax=Vibrio sp. EA2 TaxID=3079860 RepID=UPI0029497FAB|nr:HupE/UreJ family protein [Vibrio sp. EA2]MDV6249790.1 HupE/UreJ family protein [Vibrio sp. EA2]
MASIGLTFLSFIRMSNVSSCVVIMFALLPCTAQAHLVNTGLGPVYDGITHLFITPEDLLTAVTLALYCGLLGAAASRLGMFVFPVVWCIGGLIGLDSSFNSSLPVSAFSFLLLGVLVAADIALPRRYLVVIIVLVGLVHGVFNGQSLQTGPAERGLIGTIGALFVLMTLVSACVVVLKPTWTRIAVRVLGSWVSASGILLFGWHLREMHLG